MMKKNNILFGLISILCVGTAAGCGGDGEPKYNIKTALDNQEGGTIKGGGSYKQGEQVTLQLFPAEGCNFSDSPPMVAFIPEGSELAQSEEAASISSDGTHFVYQVNVNNGADGSASTVGTYKATFMCKTNTIEALDSANSAKYTVYRKVLKDKNDASKGYHTIATDKAEQKEVVYGTKLPQDNYLDGVDGKITWYVTDDEWELTTTEYDFKNAVKSDLYLIGVVSDSSTRGIVEDAIANFKKNDKMVITDEAGVKATVLNLKDIANKKMYFQLGNRFIISDNNYYQIKASGGTSLYYKLPLVAPDAADGYDGFKVQDIKDFYDYVELNYLEYDADDAATADVDEGVSIKKNGSNDYTEKIEIFGSRMSYDSTAKTFIYNELTYTIDATNNKILQGETDVGTLVDSVYVKFSDSMSDATLKGKTYKIDGNYLNLIVDSPTCKVYQIKKDGKLYMDLYISNGNVYKIIRYKVDGVTKDESYLVNHAPTDVGTTKPSTIYDMNLLKLVSSNTALNTALATINGDFDTMLKNVTVEAKTLKTLIDENDDLKEILKAYDYKIQSGGEDVDTSKVFPINTSNSVITLNIIVNAEYKEIGDIVTKLREGNFTMNTTISVMDGEETLNQVYVEDAGNDVLTTQPGAMKQTTKKILMALNGLATNYDSFKYSTNASGDKIYKFYEENAGENDPYLIFTLDSAGNLKQIEFDNDDNNRYTSTFVFEETPAA